MLLSLRRPGAALSLALIVVAGTGCAIAPGTPRPLMPTPILYQQPGGKSLFTAAAGEPARPRGSPDLDLLYITNRLPETDPAAVLPYGQERAKWIAFGNARIRLVPALDWPAVNTQSTLAARTRKIDLQLGEVRELGRFPREPYTITLSPDGSDILRDPEEMARHDATRRALQQEVQRRMADLPRREVLLYVHGFNETFETAAFTAAELCHFLGREHVCAFFTWPASATGNFLISYTSTTESADYAVEHLKKTIRTLATTPGIEHLQLLAHSRGSALMLAAVRELVLEAIAAGRDADEMYRIDNLVLMSPDIDLDIAGQQLTGFLSDPDLTTVRPGGRLPRAIEGRLTVYSSPEDRALLVSRILFRSRNRVGQLRPEDLPEATQRYLANLGRMDLITYEGKRTDFFGHSYFTSNPEVSSDLIAMIRYDVKPGEPGRPLIRTGPISWRFPARGRGD